MSVLVVCTLIGIAIVVNEVRRRGSRREKKRKYVLIVVADDFGISESRNRGIVEAIRQGAVGRTSIMANGAARDQAVESALKSFDLSVGLHLNLTEGRPLSKLSRVKSLLGEDGKTFKGKYEFRYKKNELNLAEVENEVRAQIQWFRDKFKRSPLYVDGHQHCHVVSVEIARVIARVFNEEGVRMTRIPQERSVNTSKTCVTCANVSREAKLACDIYESENIQYSKAFAGLTFCGQTYSVNDLVNLISNEFESVSKTCEDEIIYCDLMTHPGADINSNTSSGSWDSFDESRDRVTELKTLCDPSLLSVLSSHGIELYKPY